MVAKPNTEAGKVECTASWTGKQTGRWLGSRIHILVLASVVLMTLLGQQPESGLGWVACPPQSIEQPDIRRQRTLAGLRVGPVGLSIRAGWEQMRYTWIRALARSELLAVLWVVGGQGLPGGVLLLPWLECVVEGVSVAWPWLGRQPEVRCVRWGLGWLRWGSLLLFGLEIAWQGLEQVSTSCREVSGDWPTGRGGNLG